MRGELRGRATDTRHAMRLIMPYHRLFEGIGPIPRPLRAEKFCMFMQALLLLLLGAPAPSRVAGQYALGRMRASMPLLPSLEEGEGSGGSTGSLLDRPIGIASDIPYRYIFIQTAVASPAYVPISFNPASPVVDDVSIERVADESHISISGSCMLAVAKKTIQAGILAWRLLVFLCKFTRVF